MTAEEALKEIMEWADSSHAFLSTRTDYGRGYKDGITRAKVVIEDILCSRLTHSLFYRT